MAVRIIAGREFTPADSAGAARAVILSDVVARQMFGSWRRVVGMTLRPSGLAMKGFKVVTTGDGGLEFEPYRFAELGLRLAGKPRAIVDRMHPCDQFGLGMVALGFTMRGPEIGKTLSL